jgi:hypothetical protein
MTTTHPSQPRTGNDTLPDISLADRAEHMARMSLNALMKNCGVLASAELEDWLDGANVTCHPDNFGGFEILYGFDLHAQDFIVVKNKNPEGPHFAVIADQRGV